MKYLKTFEEKDYKLNEVPFAVSHHLGNPIDAIDSFVGLAKKFLEKGNIEKTKECLDDAEKTIENAKKILNDFRTGKIKFISESSSWTADPEDNSWAIFRISHGKGFVTSLNGDSIGTCHYKMKYSDPKVLKFSIDEAKRIITKNVSFYNELGIVNKNGVQRIYNKGTKMFDAK